MNSLVALAITVSRQDENIQWFGYIEITFNFQKSYFLANYVILKFLLH